MVAADQGDAIGMANFKTEEEKEGLERVEAAVDKVAWRVSVDDKTWEL